MNLKAFHLLQLGCRHVGVAAFRLITIVRRAKHCDRLGARGPRARYSLLFRLFAAHALLGAPRRWQLLLACIPSGLGSPAAVAPSVRTDTAANCDRRRRLRNAMCSSLCLPRVPLGNRRAVPGADPIRLAPAPLSMHRPYPRRSSLAALRSTFLSPASGTARHLCDIRATESLLRIPHHP